MNDDRRERGPLDFSDEDDEARRWAHRRDPDLPPEDPEAAHRDIPVPRTPGASRYTWFIGVVAVLLIAVVTLNSIRQGGHDPGIPAGSKLPPFAAPLVTSTVPADTPVNLYTRADQGRPGSLAACDVRRPDALNACALWRRGPLVVAFFAMRSGRCVDQLDAVERVRRRVPGVQFAAVAIRGERAELARLARAHRWGFPVGYDADGRLANAYHVAVCPQITFARRGGVADDTTFGELSEDELAAQARRLAR
jgi:hypothetical protein